MFRPFALLPLKTIKFSARVMFSLLDSCAHNLNLLAISNPLGRLLQGYFCYFFVCSYERYTLFSGTHDQPRTHVRTFVRSFVHTHQRWRWQPTALMPSSLLPRTHSAGNKSKTLERTHSILLASPKSSLLGTRCTW